MSDNNCKIFEKSNKENSIINDAYIETPWTIIQSYFKGQHLEKLVRHQLESYNNFVNHQIIKTIRKKYILGKNKSGNVGVLIKDKNTRKRILSAQNELKRKPMTEIKKYLIDHGLIKIGTYAPNDVIRKIYESSILSGDISNQQKDVLLHNYTNSDENK